MRLRRLWSLCLNCVCVALVKKENNQQEANPDDNAVSVSLHVQRTIGPNAAVLFWQSVHLKLSRKHFRWRNKLPSHNQLAPLTGKQRSLQKIQRRWIATNCSCVRLWGTPRCLRSRSSHSRARHWRCVSSASLVWGRQGRMVARQANSRVVARMHSGEQDALTISLVVLKRQTTVMWWSENWHGAGTILARAFV